MIQFKKLKLTQYINSDYHLLNLLVFFTILVFLLYLKTEIITIKCPYSEIGIKCKTCGLTTSFKNLINGDLKGENKGHLLLFLLFALQLIIRPIISFLLFKTRRQRLIRNVDIAITILIGGLTYIELTK